MKELKSFPSEVKSRRKLLTGIGLLSFFSLFRSGLFSKKHPVIDCAPPADEKKTMKVLSQDGRLVEVDVSRINRIKTKISDEELQNWIRKG